MKKINVIDFDKTLLPYDSFRKYILIFLRNKQSASHILPLLILRKLRLLNSSVFKKRVIKLGRKVNNYNDKMKEFSDHLFADIDDSIVEKVRSHTDSKTINILCTASPDDYAKHLAELLGWECLASQLDSKKNHFVHMHGKRKVEAIKELYPEDKFRYNFAISDSQSDEELLKKFGVYKLTEKSFGE